MHSQASCSWGINPTMTFETPRRPVSVECELHTQLQALFQFCNFYGWLVVLTVQCEYACCHYTAH